MKIKACLPAIKAEYRNLTKKERQLADYVLENYESVVSMTASELSERAGVVKSLIVRFCRALGFSGYTEFKLMLSRELARNEQFNFTPYISREDSNEDIFKKIFSSNIKTLHDTLNGLDTDVFSKAVETLERAGNIYIYGVGTSAGIANDFQYRLTETGRTAFFFNDIVSMRVSALNIKEGDAAIGISHTGRTAATVDALKFAKEKGVKTVCVTSYPNSEITKYCDYPIVIKTDEIQYPIEAISARIALISVLDSLAVALSSKKYDEAVERSAENHDLIETLRY